MSLDKRYCQAALLIVRAGKEKRALSDIRDLIYPYDPSVQIYRTKYSGLLLLFTNLKRSEISNILTSVPLPFLIKFIVFDKFIYDFESYEELVEYIKKVLTDLKRHKYIITFKVNLRGKSTKALAFIGEIRSCIESLSNLKNNHLLLKRALIKVEIIDNFIGLVIEKQQQIT